MNLLNDELVEQFIAFSHQFYNIQARLMKIKLL